MEWIVNEAPPSLPRSHFSTEFCDFVDRWLVYLLLYYLIRIFVFSLKKSTSERADLITLLV